jgi:hypothetical protein
MNYSAGTYTVEILTLREVAADYANVTLQAVAQFIQDVLRRVQNV